MKKYKLLGIYLYIHIYVHIYILYLQKELRQKILWISLKLLKIKYLFILFDFKPGRLITGLAMNLDILCTTNNLLMFYNGIGKY